MTKCSVKKCAYSTKKRRKRDGIYFFKFPRDPYRRAQWGAIIARDRQDELFKPNDSSLVCSTHFPASDIYTTKKGFNRLKATAKPILNMSEVQDNDTQNQSSETINAAQMAQASSAAAGITGSDNNKQVWLKSPTPSTSTSLSVGSILDSPRKKLMKDEIRLCRKTIDNKNKTINNLRKQNKRLRKKNSSLKNIVSILKKRENIDYSVFQDLSKHVEVTDTFNAMYLKNMKNKKRPFAKYPPGARKFALTLHFYSPAAYKYVRRIFDTCLPHPNTLYSWYSSVDAKPGFTAEALDRLKDKVKFSKKEIICALVADEMHIRPQKTHKSGNLYEGLVDMGFGTDSTNEIATQAYVMMLVGINDSFKIPFAYFLVASLKAEMKAHLINIALEKCHSIGVKVVSVTFDGCKTNTLTMKLLGCQIDDPTNLKTYFKHPSASYNVAVLLDACHMIKLVRNTLESKKVFYDADGNLIKWAFIPALHELQDNKELHLGNKLTHRHIAFRNEIMKVKLATQLLSRSVANAIDFCENHLCLSDFENSSATVKFIMYINNVFDILNARKINDHGFKKPLSQYNATEILTYVAEAKRYLTTLTIKVHHKRTIKTKKETRVVHSTEETPLWKAVAGTGIIGLIVCLESLEYLYTTLIVNSQSMSYLLSYKLSQDHIELFFGNIRSQGGFNNNPNTAQFKSAYKKLLMHLELGSKFTGNAIPLENIPILSGQNTITHLNTTSVGYREDIESEIDTDMHKDSATETVIQANCDIFSGDLDALGNCSEYIKQVVGYIAGYVVRKLMKSMRCDICINSLLAKERYDFHKLIDFKNLGGLFYASEDVFTVCKATETFIRRNMRMGIEHNNSIIASNVLKTFMHVNIFTSCSEEVHNNNHRIVVIKSITNRYLTVRLHYIAKKESFKSKCRSKRQLYNKLNLFQGN